MIMKMPSQSLNWPSNKWRASGWEEEEREGSCGAPCKNQSHRKLKVICLLKHPRQNRRRGCHLKCETHANIASKDWGTVINRVACVQHGVWAGVATVRARQIPQEAEPGYRVNAPYTGLYFICTRSALLITHCLFNLSHLLLLFLVACTGLC